MNSKLAIVYALLPTLIGLGSIQAVQANNDHQEARRLLESGDILPLESILKSIRQKFSGKIIEIELEHKDEHLVYEVEILGEDGVIREAYINAKTGQLIELKEDK